MIFQISCLLAFYSIFFFGNQIVWLYLKTPPPYLAALFPSLSLWPSSFTVHRSLWDSTPDLLHLKERIFRTPVYDYDSKGVPRKEQHAWCVCGAAAVQWKKRRAAQEMGTVPGLSPTRSWGKCCECAVLALPVVVLWFQLGAAFNLDTENRVVFTGPPGSYFGYSVEFFKNSSR